MTANTLPTAADAALASPEVSLGGFLRDRRARLQPSPGTQGRRRTPGLRREEVAARAGVSVTWYTWLEQGRGGPPSDEVLERLAGALELDATGREVLFLLAQQRPPPLKPSPTAAVTPALQRVLDALATSPAIVKTPAWDIVAWNDAAAAVLGDYAAAPARERNVLRRMFGDPAMRQHLTDWEANARFALAVFRVDMARAGGGGVEAQALAAELQATSADFRRLWAENDLRRHGVGVKQLQSQAGPLTLEVSAFNVDGAEGLTMLVFSPVSAADARTVAALVSRREPAAPAAVKLSA
ncbi:MAG: XRE family transcriptional regulator [Phenylobacterium sp.]|nr:MAG: XRE family transcriptional regulator [Phenylobacterium sp.]